jgi:hypothetical protein
VVQAADWFLRRHLDETRLDAVSPGARTRSDDAWTVVLRRGTETWQVVIGQGRRAPAQLTCRAVAQNAAPAYELRQIAQLA